MTMLKLAIFKKGFQEIKQIRKLRILVALELKIKVIILNLPHLQIKTWFIRRFIRD
jgi:hypothetical protein